MRIFGFDISRSATRTAPALTPAALRRRRGTAGAMRMFGGLLAEQRLSSKVLDTPQSIDSLIYRDWIRAVAHSRYISEHSDHAKKFIALLRENVVGSKGFTLRPQIIKADGKPDIATCDAITDAWEAWSQKGNCEATGAMSRADAERLAIAQLAHTGEFFIQLCYGVDAGPWGFSIRFIDATRVDPRLFNEGREGGNYIKHGIEFNQYGRPVAYYFRKDNERSITGIGFHSSDYERVPADQIIHGFITEYAGQRRGLPLMRTAVEQMRVLHDFTDCTLVNARISAAKMGFFKDGAETTPTEPIDANDLPSEAKAGCFNYIANYDFVSPDWQFPDASVEPFTRGILRSIASGLNASYNNLASDLTSVNFSSIRQGAFDEREAWIGLQDWFSSANCSHVFTAWLSYSLLAGKIKIAGQALRATSLSRCQAVTFRGRRWAWIDPAAEMTAAEKAIALKLKSRSQVIRDNGDNPWDVWQETHTEEEDMRSLDIDPAVKIAGDTSPAKTPLSQTNTET